MDWTNVPAYLRPAYQRDDPGLLMPYPWAPRVRELWRVHVEMGQSIGTALAASEDARLTGGIQATIMSQGEALGR